MSATNSCSACGMPVKSNAYHPYAACLMFKASQRSAEVQANLAAVESHGAAQERASLRERVEAMRLRHINNARYSQAAALLDVLALLAEPGEERP